MNFQKNTIFLLLTFSFSNVTFSQNKAIELLQTGVSNFQSGKYQEAIDNYTELINKIDEKTIQKRCYINRGLSYDKIEKFDLAISDFTKAIKLDSTDMASFIDRGISKMHAGYLEDSKKDYRYVVVKNKDKKMMESALYWLAQINYGQRNYDNAIKNCDRYFTINSIDPEIYFIRGTANDMLQKFELSIADYTKAIELYPNYPQAYANRGTAKINQLTTGGNIQPTKKETKSACKDLKKARELGDNSTGDLIYIYCDRKEKKKK